MLNLCITAQASDFRFFYALYRTQLTGVNLNTSAVQELAADYAGVSWQYKSAKDLNRPTANVLVERDLKAALIRTK